MRFKVRDKLVLRDKVGARYGFSHKTIYEVYSTEDGINASYSIVDDEGVERHIHPESIIDAMLVLAREPGPIVYTNFEKLLSEIE